MIPLTNHDYVEVAGFGRYNLPRCNNYACSHCLRPNKNCCRPGPLPEKVGTTSKQTPWNLQYLWRSGMVKDVFQLPSGYVKIAIENDHRNSGFSHWKWWLSIAMLVYQRVSTPEIPWFRAWFKAKQRVAGLTLHGAMFEDKSKRVKSCHPCSW